MIKRRKAELKKLKEDTRTRAIETFLRELYPEQHPNSPPSLNSQINALGKINVNDLKEFQKKYYGLGSFNICFVGDVDHNSIEQHLIKHFDGWDLNSTSTKRFMYISISIFKLSRLTLMEPKAGSTSVSI